VGVSGGAAKQARWRADGGLWAERDIRLV
jgi:hypothetical protein